MNIAATLEKIRPVANALLGNTMGIIDKTRKEITTIWRVWNISSIIFKLSYIGYLIFALATGLGNLYVNIGFLVFSVAYFVFDMTTKSFADPIAKRQIGETRRVFRYVKIVLIDAVKLTMSIYGVIISWNDPSVIGVVLAVFAALVFVFDVMFEIIYTIVSNKYESLCSAFNSDISGMNLVKNGANFVINVIAKSDLGAAISAGANLINAMSSDEGREAVAKIGGEIKKFGGSLGSKIKNSFAERKLKKESKKVSIGDAPKAEELAAAAENSTDK